MGALGLESRVNDIMNNPHYNAEQKTKMIADLMNGGYQPVSQASLPEESNPNPSKVDLILSDDPIKKAQQQEKMIETLDPEAPVKKDDWKVDYNMPFQPTFADVQAKKHSYPIGNNKKATLRKLKLGDNMKLAALIPRWKQHLLGDLEVNPIYKEFDAITLLEVLVSTALRDWDFQNDCPSGFSLSVLDTIISFTKEGKDELDVGDLLDSDLEQVINLVVAMYRANTVFFTKIFMQHGIIRDLITTIRGLITEYKADLKAKLAEIAKFHANRMKAKNEEEKSKSSGGALTGTTTNSSGQSAKTTKGSSRTKKQKK